MTRICGSGKNKTIEVNVKDKGSCYVGLITDDNVQSRGFMMTYNVSNSDELLFRQRKEDHFKAFKATKREFIEKVSR